VGANRFFDPATGIDNQYGVPVHRDALVWAIGPDYASIKMVEWPARVLQRTGVALFVGQDRIKDGLEAIERTWLNTFPTASPAPPTDEGELYRIYDNEKGEQK